MTSSYCRCQNSHRSTLSVIIWLASTISFFWFVFSQIAQQLKIKYFFTMIMRYHKPSGLWAAHPNADMYPFQSHKQRHFIKIFQNITCRSSKGALEGKRKGRWIKHNWKSNSSSRTNEFGSIQTRLALRISLSSNQDTWSAALSQ